MNQQKLSDSNIHFYVLFNLLASVRNFCFFLCLSLYQSSFCFYFISKCCYCILIHLALKSMCPRPSHALICVSTTYSRKFLLIRGCKQRMCHCGNAGRRCLNCSCMFCCISLTTIAYWLDWQGGILAGSLRTATKELNPVMCTDEDLGIKTDIYISLCKL